MYSLDCSYYSKSFSDVNDLVNDIISSGQDPNYEITWNEFQHQKWLAILL